MRTSDRHVDAPQPLTDDETDRLYAYEEREAALTPWEENDLARLRAKDAAHALNEELRELVLVDTRGRR